MNNPCRPSMDELRKKLLKKKKYCEMSLKDLHEAGEIIFGNRDQIGFYGLSPAEFISRGCTVLGRSVIEGKINHHAAQVLTSLSAVINRHYRDYKNIAVLDLFLGTGNLLYFTATGLHTNIRFGFETDRKVRNCTRNNFRTIGFNAEIIPRNFSTDDSRSVSSEHLAVILIDPPWGEAFRFTSVLQLDKTEPPVIDIMHQASTIFSNAKHRIFVVLAHENTNESSIEALNQSFQLLSRGQTTSLREGGNIGYLFYSDDHPS